MIIWYKFLSCYHETSKYSFYFDGAQTASKEFSKFAKKGNLIVLFSGESERTKMKKVYIVTVNNYFEKNLIFP